MAYVVRPVRIKKLPGGKRKRSRASKWYACYFDATAGKWKRRAGYVDKAATLAMARRLETESSRRSEGLIDPYREQSTVAITQHLEDFRDHLLAKGDTEKHADQFNRQCRAILSGCGFQRIGDLEAAAVSRWLASRRKNDRRFGVTTSNNYLRAIKSFSRWLVENRRAQADPLVFLHVMNNATDRRHVRRVLSAQDFDRLLQVTREGPRYQNSLDGRQRYALYLAASYTGLRSTELASLTPSQLDLDARNPAIHLLARQAKSRRAAVQPIHVDLLPVLRDLVAGVDPHSLLWPGRWHHCEAVRMLRADLKRAGIEYNDQRGRVFDFHSLRAQFITSLARAGVSLVVAQKLARHSDPRLTSMTYTMLDESDLAEAVNRLPAPSTKENP